VKTINLHKSGFAAAVVFRHSLLKCLLAGIIFIIFPLMSFSQVTRVSGQVIDAETGNPIPFANILVPKILRGTLTDYQGNYFLEINDPRADSIRASILGFEQQTKALVKGISQTVNFELSSQNQDLPEVIILYEGNPADAIIDSIIKYRERSTFQSYKVKQYNSYTKAHIGLNNLDEELVERKIFKPFDFIQNYSDTSALNGKPYLPVMISETSSTIYERKFPKSKREVIKASRVSGLENTNVSQYLGIMILEVNIYSNHIEMFDKNFVSPISEHGHDYYRYYIVDSAFVDNRWCLKLNYKPRRKKELCFTGSLWVDKKSYAIVNIDLQIADDANLNFVNEFRIDQEFRWTNDLYWINTKDRLIMDFNLVKNSNQVVGAYAERTNFYDEFIFDTIDNPGIFKNPVEVMVNEDALKLEDTYWNSHRPDSLSEAEEGIYEMIDSVKNSPVYNKYKTITVGLASGYFPFGKIELGSIYKLFSYNTIEGARFRVGGRTTQELNKNFRVGAYLAYGTRDKRLKYGGDFIYIFDKNPRRTLTASYKYDMVQLGQSATSRPTDNIFASFFSRGPIDKLTMIREYKIAYDYEWFNGFSNTLLINRKELFPPANTDFVFFPESRMDTVIKNSITTTEIGIYTRFALKEYYVEGKYTRRAISNEYPVIDIKYSFGIPHTSVNDYNYHKLNISISQWFTLGTIGWSKFYVDWGKIWGTLPYPLLKIHDGNQSWLFDEYSSNLMNYYEFLSDNYIALYYTHHFDGFFFNKLPLIRRLALREVVHFRGIYGSLSEQNLDFSEMPDGLRPLGNEPYLEAGVGIENILKFFRVDAVWRLTHLNDPGYGPVSKFGIFASLYFSF